MGSGGTALLFADPDFQTLRHPCNNDNYLTIVMNKRKEVKALSEFRQFSAYDFLNAYVAVGLI